MAIQEEYYAINFEPKTMVENGCQVFIIDEQAKKIDELRLRILDLEHKVSRLTEEHLISKNRMLEQEILLERTRNILLRQKISFPFTGTAHNGSI